MLKPGARCRGGIPVCFPQFGGFGPLAQHGFARNSEFTVVDGGSSSVTLSLQTSEEHLRLFPHPFELLVTVQPRDPTPMCSAMLSTCAGTLSTCMHLRMT